MSVAFDHAELMAMPQIELVQRYTSLRRSLSVLEADWEELREHTEVMVGMLNTACGIAFDQGRLTAEFQVLSRLQISPAGPLPDCATCGNTGRIFWLSTGRDKVHRNRDHCPDCPRRGA